MLFVGGAGCGKTTAARAICGELKVDYLFVNASEDGNIDTLRTRIRQFASTTSFDGDRKVVILDEADALTPTTQTALRGFIEEFSSNCAFIMTCNFLNKIIVPLHSRCTVVEFKIPKANRPDMVVAAYEKVAGILDKEQVQYDSEALEQIVLRWYPDLRRIINELQRYSNAGKIDDSIVKMISENNFTPLVGFLKAKKFNEMRKWVVENMDNDPATVFRFLYSNLATHLKEQSIPLAVLIIADYMYKSAFCIDQEINCVACLTQLMMETEFK